MSELATIDRQGVRQAVEDNSAILAEALPAPYYEDAHIPGARNLPHDTDDATIATLLPDHDATVIVYCANLACQNSTILRRRLVQLGYTDVREYEAGKEDWTSAGLPVETGTGAAVH